MRILTITAQKPNSTGSGFYLTELVKAFAARGHEQAVISGIYREDDPWFPEGVKSYPVYFKTEELPFPIAGMSDEMPYESTVYGQMTEKMTEQFQAAFRRVIRQAAEEFAPELVVCHHLYLVTSVAREELPDVPVCGFCHNTDLRQLKKIPLMREYIRSRIPGLNRIFALHEEQKREILRVFPEVSEEQIRIAGTGYNAAVFYRRAEKRPEPGTGEEPLRLIYAGKIAKKKGVACLLRSLSLLPWAPDRLRLELAGGAGNQEEYREILALGEACRYPVRFLGKLAQKELALAYSRSDLFVLPSFSEGLPLTIMEAMACGCRVVVTDLPGIRPWVEEHVAHAPVCYIKPPEMRNADEPVAGSLEPFEKRLAEAIQDCAGRAYPGQPDLSGISWANICAMVEEEASLQKQGS